MAHDTWHMTHDCFSGRRVFFFFPSAFFCPFLSVLVHLCLFLICFLPFLSIFVHFCQVLSVFVHFCPFLSVSINFCRFLSVSVGFCPLLFVSVSFCPFLIFSVFCLQDFKNLVDWNYKRIKKNCAKYSFKLREGVKKHIESVIMIIPRRTPPPSLFW